MFCIKCGEHIEDTAEYCPKCGNKQTEEPKDETTKTTTDYTTEKSNNDKAVNIIQKCCFAGMIVGTVGAAMFFLIVMIGLIIYGKVYLYQGYDFTKVLTTISIVLMLIGLCSIIAKFVFNLALKKGNFPTSAAKRILICVLCVACIAFSIWGFVDCGNVNVFAEAYKKCDCHSPWAKYGDGYLKIDSNPYNYDSSTTMSTFYILDATDGIKAVNAYFNLPTHLYDEIMNTRALDGKLTFSGDKVNVSWRYHPDQGIEVTYTAK